MNDLVAKAVKDSIIQARSRWHHHRTYGVFVADDGVHTCLSIRPKFHRMEEAYDLVGVYNREADTADIVEDVLCAMQ